MSYIPTDFVMSSDFLPFPRFISHFGLFPGAQCPAVLIPFCPWGASLCSECFLLTYQILLRSPFSSDFTSSCPSLREPFLDSCIQSRPSKNSVDPLSYLFLLCQLFLLGIMSLIYHSVPCLYLSASLQCKQNESRDLVCLACCFNSRDQNHAWRRANTQVFIY